MTTTPTTITSDKAKNQGFMFLGGAALALFGVVPGLALAGLKIEDHHTREILGLVALVPALGGIVLSIFGLLLLSNKIKPLAGTIRR